MRKNGINRELRAIEGGVCAPEGFSANAVSCGIRKDGSLDFGMIYTPRRCAVACVYSAGKAQGAPVKVSKKNMRNGYARAILVNGGSAICMQADGEKLAYGVCDLLFPWTIERTEIVLASTGKIGERLEIEPFKHGIKPLFEGLVASTAGSARVAEAIRAEGEEGKQLSFAFDLGDYPCKIGGVFKGGPQVSPDMATFLAFLTTDVNITSPMLQKALSAETRETLNMINLDGVASPNDTVCILANGKAGNYRIDCADSEYKKFTIALRLALTEIALETVRQGGYLPFLCRVTGAPSKEAARAIARAIVGGGSIKRALTVGDCPTEGIFFTALSALDNAKGVKAFAVDEATVRLRSKAGEVVLYENEESLRVNAERIRRIFAGEEAELLLDFGVGNYAATAYGRK